MSTSESLRYEEIADTKVIRLLHSERKLLNEMLEQPTQQFKDLVMALHHRGCEFPKQQAALMLRNTPRVAELIIRRHQNPTLT